MKTIRIPKQSHLPYWVTQVMQRTYGERMHYLHVCYKYCTGEPNAMHEYTREYNKNTTSTGEENFHLPPEIFA